MNTTKNLDAYQVVIKSGSSQHYWVSLWHYRELLWVLVHRDVAVRYKQTAVGIIWALLKPALTMIAFTIVFSKIAKLPSHAMPYPLLVLTGLLPWYFFSSTINEMANSIINNGPMVSKIYFPRLLLPLSAIGAGLVDLGISLIFLFVLMLFYDAAPHWTLIFLPVFTLMAIVTCLAGGLFFAALNVIYRDVRYVVPLIIQFGLYISPVGFSSDIIPEKWRLLYSLNPLVGVIDGFRWAVGGQTMLLYMPGVILSVAVSLTLTTFSLWYFKITEKKFADVI